MSTMKQVAAVGEQGQDVERILDWNYVEWHKTKDEENEDEFEDGLTGLADAETQTTRGENTEDKETQTSVPFVMRIDLARTHSKLRQCSLVDPLFQFDRQAPARISTSPTLRRMRSTRRPLLDLRDSGGGRMDITEEESAYPSSPSPSPLAAGPPPSASMRNHNGSHGEGATPGSAVTRMKPKGTGERRRDDITEGADQEEMEPGHKRLQERRRSSVVVTLPGLDMSPGDLFVSNGVADILSRSTFSDTKKSKWPFSRRSTTKGKPRMSSEVEKCLSTVQIADWRDIDFQKYKDYSLEEFLGFHSIQLRVEQDPLDYRRQEAIWELFTSECVYFLDQLMVLKEVFLSTLTNLQMNDCLQDVDSWRLFANLNELCLVSFGFLSSLLRVIKESWEIPVSGTGPTLLNLLNKAFRQSIGQCLQKYCLNYSSALFYLDSLKPRDDFACFLKWCERNQQCRRLQLRDLLVAPLQRLTRYPLLLKNIAKRSRSEEEESSIQEVVELVDGSLCDLEGKVKWLDNYHKVKQLKDALVWLPVWDRDRRVFVPENLKHLLKAVTLENLIAHRSLLHEGKLILTENAKMHDVYLFLFDEFLLITKIKRSKKRPSGTELNALRPPVNQELDQLLKDGCTFTVLDQPVSVDRMQLKNVDQLNATASGLPHSFIIMHQNRYQQCVGVFVLQAQSEAVKKTWMAELEGAVAAMLKLDCETPRVKGSAPWLESLQI